MIPEERPAGPKTNTDILFLTSRKPAPKKKNNEKTENDEKTSEKFHVKAPKNARKGKRRVAAQAQPRNRKDPEENVDSS